MIRKVVLHRFKRFDKITFDLPGHVVLAGPNNSGKTTLLQAISSWDLAVRRWLELYDFEKQVGGENLAPIARQAFLPVPLRTFDLLWHERAYDNVISIEVHGTAGWSMKVDLIPDTTEQVFIRIPWAKGAKSVFETGSRTVFVPAMSGVAIEEPLYANPATLEAMLARVRAGDVLRNLLFQASLDDTAWRAILASVNRLFGYELLPLEASAAFIWSGYKERQDGPTLDLMGAGSGFQQVLMLLCFLHTRKNSILLLDEPDAHLHVILQDAIYDELRGVAARNNSQLVIATHSEVIVNAAELDEIRVAFNPEKPLADQKKKQNVVKALRWVTNIEITEARTAPGILYLESYSDLQILRAWARVLEHPSLPLLTTELFWRKTTVETPSGQEGISAREHYDALTLVRALPGLVLVDGDAKTTIKSTPVTGKGLQRLRWRRYEIESYLVHPVALARFVEKMAGTDTARGHVEALETYLRENLPPGVIRDPFVDHPYLRNTKARVEILPPVLAAAELPAFPDYRFHEIAAVMKPDEIHPEVVEKLDAICKAFGR